jgi:hypothetical protein
MVGPVLGLFGGVAGTLVAAALLAMDDRAPLPAALLAARTSGGEPVDYLRVGVIGQFVYGVPAGAVYVLLLSALGIPVGWLPAALLSGTIYGVALFLAVRAVLSAAAADADAFDRQLLVAHALYGLILGIWLVIGPVDPTATPGPV